MNYLAVTLLEVGMSDEQVGACCSLAGVSQFCLSVSLSLSLSLRVCL